MPKPRLVRQEAVQEEEDTSPPRLGVRFLPTIPSAADSSVIMEDGDSGLMSSITGLYANLQNPPQTGISCLTNTSKTCSQNLTAAVPATPTTVAATNQQHTLIQKPPQEQKPPEILPRPQDKPP